MNIKKRHILLTLFLIFLILIPLVMAQDPISEQSEEMEELGEDIEDIGEFIEDIPTGVTETTWLQDLKEFFGNTCEASKGFTKYIIGKECDLNSAFGFALLIWFLLFFIIGDILSTYSMFSSAISYIISFGFMIIIANTTLIDVMADALAAFFKGTFESILIGIAIVVIFFIGHLMVKKLKEATKKSIEESKLKTAKEIIKGTAEAIRKATKTK